MPSFFKRRHLDKSANDFVISKKTPNGLLNEFARDFYLFRVVSADKFSMGPLKTIIRVY